MPLTPAPGETYTIRRKILTFLGATFHVYGPSGDVVAYCRQKAFRLREDIRLYTDDTKSTELLTLSARSIIDFGVTFDVTLPDGSKLGSIRRKGLKSLIRDSWLIYNHEDRAIASIEEDSMGMAVLRRTHDLMATVFPQKFHVVTTDGAQEIATFRQHFNPLVYRLGVSIKADHPEIDELVVLAAGCLLAAIEGRQG